MLTCAGILGRRTETSAPFSERTALGLLPPHSPAPQLAALAHIHTRTATKSDGPGGGHRTEQGPEAKGRHQEANGRSYTKRFREARSGGHPACGQGELGLGGSQVRGVLAGVEGTFRILEVSRQDSDGCPTTITQKKTHQIHHCNALLMPAWAAQARASAGGLAGIYAWRSWSSSQPGAQAGNAPCIQKENYSHICYCGNF